MRLAYLKLKGFRRFLDAEAQLYGRLIALVGPNEAGKSSLLAALEHLSSNEAFPHGDISHEYDFPEDHSVLEARFLLDEADRRAIEHLRGGAAARWFVVYKRRNGSRATRVEPSVELDFRHRQATLPTMRRLLKTKWSSALRDAEDTELGAQLAAIADLLESDSVRSTENTEVIRAITESLYKEAPGVPKLAQRLGEQLDELLKHEPAESAPSIAGRILLARRPVFLKFSQDHRDLQSEYDLADMDLDNPPRALQNLALLAKLDLSAILRSVQAGDYATPERPIEMANRELERFFRQSWTQSGIAVRLSHHETRLHLLITTPDGPYTTIGERSDGLRAFVALATFAEVHGHNERDLVLLIDEAETHLHYNAQADLVRVLDLQQAASSVIYTTHSAGCLPEDLGSSVRVVVRTDDTWSEVQNAFWTKGVGFDPLLMGMGASALVFGAIRRAVIAEGASDLILLPALIREANELTSLGYQVAPGVAEVSESAVADLDLQAAKAAYVVDDDLGGGVHTRKLRAAGIPPSRIFVLGQGIKTGLAVEDLVDRDVYLQAVNEELERSGRSATLKTKDVPLTGRSRAVRKWCQARKYSEPSKVHIATNLVLRRQIERPLLSPLGRQVLQRLHLKLSEYFGGEPLVRVRPAKGSRRAKSRASAERAKA